MNCQVHVIILNWNNAEATLGAVRAVRAWRQVTPCLHVVDNHSTDDSLARLKAAFPSLLIHTCAANLGFAGGNNEALRALPADDGHPVLLLNNDAVVSEDAVLRMLDVLRENESIAVVGPVLVETHQGISRRYCGGRDIGRFVHTRIPCRNEAPAEGCHRVDYVPGTVFLVRAGIFEKYGLLDEDFFFSGEIADFCRRLRTRDHQCAVALAATAQHQAGDTPLRDTLYTYYTLRNRFLYIRKHDPERYLRRALFWTGCGGIMLALALLKGRFSKGRAVWFALVDGLTGNFGNSNDRFLT
ncbi:MAG: glycosyltransferase family 2 protein [Spartobacteria bacterium]|nr:glycosyltransferase family 2 protein [Spartobacteria bacterium]